MSEKVIVIGGGLAGVEAAWQLAKENIEVELYEMKPVKFSPAHHMETLAELVCSNSLKAKRLVPKNAGRIKVLARGVMTKTLTIMASKFSLQAVKMITLAGGHADIED